MLPIPLDGAPQPSGEVDRRREAECFARTRGIQLPTRLAIGLARVPHDAARVADFSGNHLREFADSDLVGRAQIHRVALVIALRGEDDALGGVIDVQEFPRRAAVAPDDHFCLLYTSDAAD